MATREIDFWNERTGPRIAPEHLGDILATAADIAMVVSGAGIVHSISVNPLNAGLGRLTHWEGRDIRDVLAPDSERKVVREIAAVISGAAERAPGIEVNHVDGAEWEAPIRYVLHPTGRDGRVLMLGRDLRPVAELQQRLTQAQIALERDGEAQRVYETRFRALLASTSDGFLLLDAATGRVAEANARAAEALGLDGAAALVGSGLAGHLSDLRRGELIEALAGADADRPLRVVPARGGGAVLLHPRAFRSGGDRVLLCRAVPEGEAPADAPGRRDAFVAASPDAIAFTDRGGRIVDANDAFLGLTDLDALGDARGRMLADFLARGSVDAKGLTDRTRPRLYPTQVVSAFGTRAPVEIAVAELPEGYAFTLRESDRSALPTAGAVPDDATENARALVGTMPLRDIVASMTDVVEKECIVAAIEMTDNNRVAAAEMLGLSRQSLYVKLRKYGMLSRGE